MRGVDIPTLRIAVGSNLRAYVSLFVQFIGSIKSIYNTKHLPLDITPIRDWSRRSLSTAYMGPVVSSIAIVVCLILIVSGDLGSETGVLTLSLLPPARFKESRWVVFARVSTTDQLDNTSLDKQLSSLNKRLEDLEGEIVRESARAESGAEMDRKSLEKILEMADDDEFDVLAVWKLDRLTRSDPWESIRYLSRLRDNGVVLYSDSHGFFDWEDRRDFEILVRELLFAREWYSRIKENAEDGQLKRLREGKYPFGKPHFGYEKDDEDHLHLTGRGKQIIPAVFDHYIESENRAETRRRINRELVDDGKITDSQIKTVLESPLCIGQLTLRDRVVKTVPTLQCVPKQTYNEAQEIIEERRPDTPDGESIPGSIEQATMRFGPEFVGQLFDKFTAVCKECEGELTETNSTTLVRDTRLIEYDCEDCDFRGPLFSEREINKLDSTLPLGCPFCISVDAVTGEKDTSSALEYLYTCKHCGNQFAVNVPPNKYKRAFERPNAAYRWNTNSSAGPDDDDKSCTAEETAFIWDITILSDGG